MRASGLSFRRVICSCSKIATTPVHLRGFSGAPLNYDGPQFYDDAVVFDVYMQRRARAENPNDTLEKPVVMQLIGDVSGLDVLDLGCGDAAFGSTLLAMGAQSYLGVDGSTNMIALAQKTLAGSVGRACQADIQQWPFPDEAADLVTARLVFHYVADLDSLMANIYRSLRAGGRLVFSVEHPVITSCNTALSDGGLRQDWIVDDYFRLGLRQVSWLGAQVVKFHRTIEEHFLSLRRAGFVVESLRESKPDRSFFSDEATYQRRLRIPLFLFFSATKTK